MQLSLRTPTTTLLLITFAACAPGASEHTQTDTDSITQPECNLDVDANGHVDQGDAMLLVRYAFGFTGKALVDGTVAESCGRCSASEILATLNQCRDANVFDVDSNGETDALSDGLMIYRHILGYRGRDLVAGAVDPRTCARCDAPEIERYIESLYPPSPVTYSVSYRGETTYTTWSGVTGSYRTWEGQRIVLRAKMDFNPQEAQLIVSNLDSCLAQYQAMGQTLWPTAGDDAFGGKGQVALVPDGTTCGAGCGAGGRAELTETTFLAARGDRPNSDAYAWWVACYELGRQGGRAFPIYEKLDNAQGDFGSPGERMTSAFPEYIWQTWLRKMGYTQEELLQRGPFASSRYRAAFLTAHAPGSSAEFVRYTEMIEPSTKDLPVATDDRGDIWPSQVLASVLVSLHRAYGDRFMLRFFKEAKNLGPAWTSKQAACNILTSARSAERLTTGSNASAPYLVEQWRFPNDCN